MEWKLENHYTIKQISYEEFWPLFNANKENAFGDDHSIFPQQFYSEKSKEKLSDLKKNLENRFRLQFGVFSPENKFIGWSWGFQKESDEFYFCNSAILEPHKRKGLYSEILKISTKVLKEKGFQSVTSRHCATNNPVIIAKLKAGFKIYKMELSDVFGVCVHLQYLFNEKRKQVLDYRSGYKKLEVD